MQLISKDFRKLNPMRKLILISFLFLFVNCSDSKRVQVHQGYALGTSYSIQYGLIDTSYDKVQQGVDSLFTVINTSMSTYVPTSDISKINKGDTSIAVDSHFKTVFAKATSVWKTTDGFFDPTVGAWVNAYGFGPEKPLNTLTDENKAYLSKITGWNTIELTELGFVKKQYAETYLDFNALAKGYTVDVIGDYLSRLGAVNYLVEIGGEIVAHGVSPKTAAPWRIAIDDPNQQEERDLIQVLTLKDEAIATSGNYRKSRIDSVTGERYVHSINPLTGNAVKSNVLSASVRAANCMTADAYATALMVLPFEKSKALIERLPQIEAYWVTSFNDSIQEHFSTGWKQ